MLSLQHITLVCFAFCSWFGKITQTESSNISSTIIQRQYYEDHIILIHFKNVRHDLELNRISVEYRCMSGIEIDPICIADWQPVPLCHVNRTERDVFYNCIIRHNRVLLSFKYEIKAAILSSLGWRNQTTSFTVELPRISEPLEELTAVALDYETVRLSWKRVRLMHDLQNFQAANIHLVMKVVRTFENTSTSEMLHLKPDSVSTKLRGFKSSRNYSLIASYHFIVSKLVLPWSDTTGPITVWIPEKVTLSKPAANQSCEEVYNGTVQSLNITWLAPMSKRNVGKLLKVRLTIEYAAVQLFHEVSQRPGTQGSFLLQERPRSDVYVTIFLCNEAGCSSSSTLLCLYSSSNASGNPAETTSWEYVVGMCTIVLISAVSFFLYRYIQKRKLSNRRDSDDNGIEVITPPHPYDEPYFVVMHEYNEFPIRDTSENTEGETVSERA